MKTIRNTSARPIKVPLPGGKAIHLGPFKNGEIADRAAEHPPLAKLIEAGDIEIVSDGVSRANPRNVPVGTVNTSSQGHQPSSGTPRSGER